MAIPQIVRTLLERVRTAMTTKTSQDWKEVLQGLEQEIAAQRAVLSAARAQLEREHFVLFAKDDQVGLRRLRKAVREAQERLNELQESAELARRSRDAARAAEELADEEGRWRRAEQLGIQLQEAGANLQAVLDEVVTAFEHAVRCATAFYEAVPAKPEAIPPVLVDGRLVHDMDLYLFGKSGGKLLPRRANLLSAYQIAQGPDLRRRFTESVLLGLKRRPPTGLQEPPPAA